MILWLLLYSLIALAQNESAIDEYCFSSAVRLKNVNSRLKFILVPADKTQEDKNCLTVSTPPHRKELIQNYIKRLDPAVQIGFTSSPTRTTPCHIKVEKIRTRQKDSTGGALSTNLNATIESSEMQGESSEVLSIQTLKEFELIVNQDVIKGECRVINPSRYEISLEVRKDAIPLIPPVPPGTVVIVPDSALQKVQETSRLQTTLQLNSGERLEIGSTVKKLKDDAHKIDLSTGVAVEKTDGTQNEKVFLSIN